MTSRHSESSHRTFSSRSGNNTRDRRTPDDFWDFDLPISRRGRFFDDSVFESSRFDFDKKINEILGRWGEEERLDRWDDDDFRPSSNFNRYRNMRAKDLRDDNQAITVTSDDTAHKIVLDVQDFLNGEMKVKVVGERELAVEGRLGDNRSFRRSFSLPQNTDMDAITSVMSADGILTITAPQKGGKTTANKGTGASQMNTKERCTMSSESRKEGSQARGEGSKHTDASARTEDNRSARSYQTSLNSGFRDVPFMKRGRFFDDSFFESSRFDFDKKVNEILSSLGEEERLDRWDDDADHRLHNFNRYRNLRARDLRDDNQAMTVTSDDTTHKIVLDVQDFVNGEMKVKVVGDRELTVEGRLDDTHSFRRSFTLPQNTDMDAITSVVSADGILTITAPQKVIQMKQETKTQSLPVQVTQDGNTKVMESSSATTQTTAATSTVAAKQRETQESETQRGTERTALTDTTQCSSGVAGEMQQSSQSFTSSQTESNIAANATKTNDTSNDGNAKLVQEGSQNKSISTQTSGNYQAESEEQQHDGRGRRRAALPIMRRGQFFNDSYFEDTWKDYQDAVRNVLARWDDHSAASTDDMTCYRRLRSRDMRDENQAITSAEDSSTYKFVLDVHDFVEGGDIAVNVVDETELVVEGRMDRDTADSKSSDHFLRRFVLPNDVQLDSISSVMSSDGVLTVIAPKKSSMRQVGGSSSSSSRRAAEELHQAALHSGKVSQGSTEISTSTACASASEEARRSEDSVHMTKAAASGKDVVIPIQLDASADTNKENLKMTEQAIAVEHNANLDNKDDHKETIANKNCDLGDNKTDALNKQLQEDVEEDDSKSGMAALRKLLQEDETYIKHKNKAIQIDNKGRFFEDREFTDWQKCFLSAVKDVLDKFREPSSEGGELAAYRGLRQRDLKLENQAAYVDENTHAHTIVLDVYDFLEGKVTAEVKDGRELIVRGTAQRIEGPSLITLTFVRPFRLPDNADLKNITAFLTADGVLVINVPRLQLPYDLPDLGGTRTKENRPRLATPCDPCLRLSSERGGREASSDLDGVTYRISPHRNLRGDEHSSGDHQ